MFYKSILKRLAKNGIFTVYMKALVSWKWDTSEITWSAEYQCKIERSDMYSYLYRCYNNLLTLEGYNNLFTLEVWKINTRITKLFFVTRLTGGGVLQPLPRFSEPNPRWNWFWYQLVGMEFFYSNIPKWVQSAKALRS